jgi:branched-chain amino acid transport system substrate-binding protein
MLVDALQLAPQRFVANPRSTPERGPAVSRRQREFEQKCAALTDNGVLREDGRMVHSMFLFEVKKPEESKGPWDYYKVLAEVPGDQAFRPLKDGGCPLVK